MEKDNGLATIKCMQCGTEFMQKNKKQKFCTTKCKTVYASAHAPRVESVCQYCGKVFSHFKSTHARFCSPSCNVKGAPKTVKTLTCVECGAKFEFVGRTKKLRCDACRKIYLSKKTMEYRAAKDPSVRIGIGSGGGQLDDAVVTNSKRHDELKALRREKYQENIQKNRASAIYKYSWARDLRSVCAFCGATDPDVLNVHHADKDRTHNSPGNLVVLCAPCHKQLHSWMSKCRRAGDHRTPDELFNQQCADRGIDRSKADCRDLVCPIKHRIPKETEMVQEPLF